MAVNIQLLNLGTTPNDNTGDPARTGGQKINSNFNNVKTAVESLEVEVAGKAPILHTHTISQVTGLQTALDGKANLSGGNSFMGNQQITGNITSTGLATISGNVVGGGFIKTGAPATNLLLANGSDIPQSTFALASSVHNPVTIGTANGLSLSTQVLSLGLASNGVTGALSGTDWNTFNNKQNALTNPVTGTGATNYISKWTATGVQGNSLIFDNGTNIGIGTTNPTGRLSVNVGSAQSIDLLNQEIGTVTFGQISIGNAVPSIIGKSSANRGLYFLGATTDNNVNGDIEFNVKQNTTIGGQDFTTLTNTAFRFSRFNTDLLTITRSGNLTALGTISASNGTLIGGTGTANRLSKWASINTQSNSDIFDNNSGISFGLESYDPYVQGITNQFTFKNKTLNQTTRLNIIGNGTGQSSLSFGSETIRHATINTDSNYNLGFLINPSTGGTLNTALTIFKDGNVVINSAANNGTDKLQVNGSAIATAWKVTGGLVSQYQTGTGTVVDFATSVRGSALTGFVSGAGTVSATDTVLQAINKLDGNINAKVSNATHTGDATGSTVLTLATVNSNVGSFGTASSVPQYTVNAKGLTTASANVPILIAQSQVTNLTTNLALKANLASPSLTGTPTAPTATAGTNTTQLATTAFVTGGIATADASNVKLTGAQTVAGVKTFSSSPIVPTAVNANEAVNKGQLDAAARPYKVYTALLNQTGTNAPVATVLENTLGGTVVWSRTNTGEYYATLTNAFVINKTVFNSTNNAYASTTPVYYQGAWISTNQCRLITTIGLTPNDSIIGGLLFEIRVYN